MHNLTKKPTKDNIELKKSDKVKKMIYLDDNPFKQVFWNSVFFSKFKVENCLIWLLSDLSLLLWSNNLFS